MQPNDNATPDTGISTVPSKYLKALELLRAEKAAKAEAETQAKVDLSKFDDDIPELDLTVSKTDYQRAVDEACKAITFGEIFERCLDARVIKKTEQPVHQWTGDSNKFSCPNPAHADDNPSAWGSRTKVNSNGNAGVWGCGTCGPGVGGDKYHLAGYLYYGRQTGPSEFNELCKRMAAEFRGVTEPVILPSGTAPPVVTTTGNVPSVATTGTTATGSPSVPDDESTDDADEATEDESGYPTYDVASVLPGGATFLDLYCAEGLKADVPREFPLWAGLTALSVAIGRRVALKMIEIPTYGNLAICLTSRSASGKGRASRPAGNILRRVLTYDATPVASSLPPEGVRVMKLPGSAEKLIANLQVTMPKGSKVATYSPPTLVEFEEMQVLVGKGAGNSSYKSYVIEFADCVDAIHAASHSNGSHEVRDGFVTFLTGTQPKHLRDQFNKRDMASGLLNRFIFPFGKVVEQRAWPTDNQDWMKADTVLAITANWAAGLASNTPSGDGHWITLDAWDDDAQEEWIHQFGLKINPMKMGDNSDLLGRMDVVMMKLILLFACNEMSERITLGHVKSAFALYDYVAGCALSLAREVNSTVMSDHMKLFLGAVADKEKSLLRPPTMRDLKKIKAIEQMSAEEVNSVTYRLMSAKQLFHVRTRSHTGKGNSGNAYTTNLGLWDSTSRVHVEQAPPGTKPP